MLIVYGVLIAVGSVAAATGGIFCITFFIIESMENENEDEEEEGEE